MSRRLIANNTRLSRFRYLIFLSFWCLTGQVLTGAAQTGAAQSAPAIFPAKDQILGKVDGIFGPAGAQVIRGWACQRGNGDSLTVQLFTRGGPGVGQLYKEYAANSSAGDEPVSSACGKASGHRFAIAIRGDLFLRAGEPIFIEAIGHRAGEYAELEGSGTYSIPAPTTVGRLGVVDAGGHAQGWAFDWLDPDASIRVAVYADGDPQLGAETGQLVWEGETDERRPEVNKIYGISGNHGFSVQLPDWVTAGMHSLSFYAVHIRGGVAGSLQGSPTVPGSAAVASRFRFSTTATGFPAEWYGYNLPPGQLSFAGLRGTVSMTNSKDIYSEILYVIGYIPYGECPTKGTNNPNGPPGVAGILWSDIIKAPTAGTFTTPVDFTLPVGLPVSNCLVVGLGGGTVDGAHLVTGTVDLSTTYTGSPDAAAQILGMDSEFCFGQNWGCEAATTDDTQSFAAVTQVTQRSDLNAIWGNISDSTFDGSADFGPPPAGPWIAKNDVYLYPASACSQFAPGRSLNGPGNYYAQIPKSAVHLVSAPLTGGVGTGVGETISPLLPGWTNGIEVYQNYSGITLNAGECLVVLFGMEGTDGAFDNEDQIRAIATPF
jgi:hypothetical protein